MVFSLCWMNLHTPGWSLLLGIIRLHCYIPLDVDLWIALLLCFLNSEDVAIDNYNPSNNYSNEVEYNMAGWTINGTPVTRRNLFKFDLSAIPGTAVVSSAFSFVVLCGNQWLHEYSTWIPDAFNESWFVQRVLVHGWINDNVEQSAGSDSTGWSETLQKYIRNTVIRISM